MRRFLWIGGGIVVTLFIAAVAFGIWAYSSVPSFTPYVYEPVPPNTWPTAEWPRSTPEAQGVNSQTLLALAQRAEKLNADDPEFFLDSLTIIRNGHIIAEIYPNPNYPTDRLHVLHSATKSIVSALIGIAIDRGFIKNVDVPLVKIFDERDIAFLDPRKQALTIGDLLTMQTGLHSRDSHLYDYEGLLALQQSDDWLQFALDLPMAADPGTRFDYSNISTFLLGAVLAKASDGDVLNFAHETLFGPLGIEDVRWEQTRNGLPIAWARMWLKPNDLAKIGLLYLQKGNWNGEQVIPSAWVEASVSPHAFPQNVVDILNADMKPNREASTENWVAQRFFRLFSDGYGYQWWLDRAGNYTALGTNGQYLFVSPEKNLVVVATGKHRGLGQFAPANLFYDFILPSVESATSLPENAKANSALLMLAVPLTRQTGAVSPVVQSEIAQVVSGMTFTMDENAYKTDNLRFDFNKDMSEVEVSFTAREGLFFRFTAGLDGRPRLTENETGAYVAKGAWTTPETLEVDVEIVGFTTFDKWEFRFAKNRLSVTEHSITGVYSYDGQTTLP